METYELSPEFGVRAFSGTGFDPDNPQHMFGSDAVRWAIWIQQAKDRGDYHEADKIRETASRFCWVMQERDATVVKPRPREYDRLPLKVRKTMKMQDIKSPIRGGVLYDAGR